jgi:hypothetical protein
MPAPAEQICSMVPRGEFSFARVFDRGAGYKEDGAY